MQSTYFSTVRLPLIYLGFTPREPSGDKKRTKPLETAEDFILIDALHSAEEAFVEPTAPSAAHNFTVDIFYFYLEVVIRG
jgi:hypothetical protein